MAEAGAAVERFDLRIITPQRTIFEDAVRSAAAESEGGAIEILPRHEPLLTPLEIGIFSIAPFDRRNHPAEIRFALNGGFLETDGLRTTIYAYSAEKESEIDPSRAREAMERAKARLAEVTRHADEEVPIDLDRAQLALMRAINRMRLTNQPVEE